MNDPRFPDRFLPPPAGGDPEAWTWAREEAHRLPGVLAAARALIDGPPLIGARFSFAELPAALAALQSGRTVGKVVVRV